MHYVDEGPRDADVLLFVHGTPTWSFEWRHVVRSLRNRYRCIAVDHLGFGLSDRPRDFSYTPEAHAENLALFVAGLGLQRFALVVHDYGGPIALPVALRDGSPVKRLVVVNSWMWSLRGDARFERAGRLAGGRLGRFLYRYANASLRLIMPSAYGDRRKLTRRIHQQYLDRFSDAWSRGAVLWPLASAILGSSEFYTSLWQRRDRLREMPALIVWGMQDAAFPPYMLDRWREIAPLAQIAEVADAGHWPHEEKPVQVIDAIATFLRSAEAPTATGSSRPNPR